MKVQVSRISLHSSYKSEKRHGIYVMKKRELEKMMKREREIGKKKCRAKKREDEHQR